jgi:DNA-binding transcriptional LysR family regulator
MLDELRHFVLIVEHGTFTRAAREAHLTQPALTASIKRLEAAMGARLLHRSRQGARPTAAGEALLPRAHAALAAVSAGRRAVAEVEGLSAGEVRLGGGATACTYLLPPIVAQFRKAHPQVTFRLRELFTPDIQAAVDAGEIDIGIAQGEPPGGRGEHWRPDPLVLVAAPEQAHQLARRGDGCLEAGTPFVSFIPGAAMRGLLDQHFPDIDIVMELRSIAAVKGLVRAGVGVALLSRVAVAIDIELGRLAVVSDLRTPETRLLSLVHAGEQQLPPAAAALRAMLRR